MGVSKRVDGGSATAPLPGTHARAQRLLVAPGCHDDAAARIVPALHARDQQRVRPR